MEGREKGRGGGGEGEREREGRGRGRGGGRERGEGKIEKGGNGEFLIRTGRGHETYTTVK